jgi:hypothetical protein
VSDVDETTLTAVQAAPPTVTVAPEAKPVPVKVMVIPPAKGPLLGDTVAIVGGAVARVIVVVN